MIKIIINTIVKDIFLEFLMKYVQEDSDVRYASQDFVIQIR